jgi:type IV pilus assembly protein PilX
MPTLHHSPYTVHDQSGMALIIGLMILLLMTLIGTSAMQTSSIQERISGNLYERNVAFHAAEAALKEGEAWLESLPSHPVPVTSCSSKPCVLSHDPTLYLEEQSDSWWQTNGTPYAGGTLSNTNTAPRYVIEYLYFVPDLLTIGEGIATGKHYYAITARGVGGSGESQAVIQSTYIKRS